MTPRTRAIVPVHLYGQCADMDPILELARQRGLAIVEDCAQAHGAEYRGKRAGTMGDAAAFSFYPTKNLGALGDGGAVVSVSREVADRARLLRNYGQRKQFEHVLRGRNSRLDELQAAALRVKLPRLDDWNERRRLIARHYDATLEWDERPCTYRDRRSEARLSPLCRADERSRRRYGTVSRRPASGRRSTIRLRYICSPRTARSQRAPASRGRGGRLPDCRASPSIRN